MIGKIIRISAASGTALSLFLVLVAAARILGPQDFGRFSFAFAFVLLLDPLLDPGLFHRLKKANGAGSETGRQYLLHSLLWKALAAPVMFAAIHFIVPRIDPSPVTLQASYLIAVSQVLKSMKEAIRAAFIAGGEIGRELVSLATEWLTLLIGGLAVLEDGRGLSGLCWAFVAMRVADLAVAWILVQGRLSGISFQLQPRFVWTIFASGLPIAAYYITANLYSYLDTVMLAAMRTQTEVGHYSAAYRVYEGLSILPLLICSIVLPRVVRRRDDPGSLQTLFSGGLKYAVGLGAFAGFNGLLLAPFVIRFFFGEGYEPAVNALRVLAIGFPAVFALNFLNNALISIERTKVVFLTALAGLAVNGALNYFLIRRYSLNGAATATVVVEGLLFLIFYWRARPQIAGVSGQIFFAVPLALLLGAGGAWFASRWGTVFELAAGNALFASVLLLSGFIGDAERRAVSDVLKGAAKGDS